MSMLPPTKIRRVELHAPTTPPLLGHLTVLRDHLNCFNDADSDSDSNEEDDGGKTKPSARSSDDRKYSIESNAGFGSNAHACRDGNAAVTAEPINANHTCAAVPFREPAQAEPGLMALGTRKRDRRTIEEIQRDMRKRRPSALSLSASSDGFHYDSVRFSACSQTRTPVRFREQAQVEPGLMALGTRKRDRRTIEEIQRDMRKRWPPAAGALDE